MVGDTFNGVGTGICLRLVVPVPGSIRNEVESSFFRCPVGDRVVLSPRSDEPVLTVSLDVAL